MNEKLVFSSTDIATAAYICSELNEKGIPFIKNIEGPGDYFAIIAGNTFNNEIKIFVNDEDYEKAEELIRLLNVTNENIQVLETPDELKNISHEEDEENEKIRKKNKSYLKYFIIYPILFCVFIAILTSILNLFRK